MQIEFAVQMTCQNCINAVKNSLSNVEGIKDVDISLERGTVVVDTSLPYSLVQEKIESTGKKAILKGYGGETSNKINLRVGQIEIMTLSNKYRY